MSLDIGDGVLVVHRKRRNTELAMVLFAVAIGIGGYTLLHLNRDATIPSNLPIVAGIWLAIGLAAHLLVRFRLPYADPLLLPIALLINGLGLVMIHRIDLISDPVASGAQTQLLWTVLGVGVMTATVLVIHDHRPLQRYTYLLGLAGLVLLLLPSVPGLGTAKFGARIWIQLGPFSFQPAELAKVVLAIAFSSYLVEKRDVLALAGGRFLGIDLPRPRDLLPILLIWLITLSVLVWQSDLGTSLLFFGLFVMLLYVATERPSWAILGTLLFVGGAVGVYLVATLTGNLGYVLIRIESWLNPFANYDQNYQIINAQFGMAWGGLLGTGLGLGRPGLTPLARSDFIIAAIGEELGTTGLMAVVVLYGLLVARGLRAALAARDAFGKLLATALSFGLALQVFTIVGGVTRLLPLTGLTTPFMSQGGTSMVVNWLILGLLLVISHHARKPMAARLEAAEEVTQVISAVPQATGGGLR